MTWRYNAFVLSFASNFRQLNQELIALQQLLVTMPWHEHRLLGGFLNSISFEDYEDSGCLLTGCRDQDMEKVHKIFSQDHRSTISGTNGRLGLLYGTCQWIQQVLNMQWISMKFVSVAHPQQEAVMNVYLPRTAGWSKKQPLEVPCNFFLFPITKSQLCGHHFQDTPDI